MIHEDATLALYPNAKNFRPVTAGVFSKTLVGWSFQYSGDKKDHPYAAKWRAVTVYGWVTNEGEVSVDALSRRPVAEANLKAYTRGRRECSSADPSVEGE